MKRAAFGAGCFWGVEFAFSRLDGVRETTVGYMGGQTENPSYEEVCTDTTGHAEVVLVEYDPDVIGFRKLVDYFFEIHDPTQINRQGPDTGTQYRSVIFCYEKEQIAVAEEMIRELEKSDKYDDYIATEVKKAQNFYKAEEYHQKYMEKNPAATCHIKI